MARRKNGKGTEILSTAVRVFGEKGYHATSMQDIADAVGMQKASLYYYISSKQDLLFKIFAGRAGALTDELAQIAATDLSATVKIQQAIDSHLNALCSQLEWFSVYLREQKLFSGEKIAPVRDQAKRHATLLEQIIQQGIDKGEFRPVDTKVTSRAILGMCNWLYMWYSPDGRLTPSEIAANFSQLVVSGLREDNESNRS